MTNVNRNLILFLKLFGLIVLSVLGPFVRSLYIFFIYKGYIQNHFNLIELDFKEIFIIYFSIATIYSFLRKEVLGTDYKIADIKEATFKKVVKKFATIELYSLFAFLMWWLLIVLFL